VRTERIVGLVLLKHYNWNFAYALFPVLAEGLDVIIPRTCAASGIKSLGGGGCMALRYAVHLVIYIYMYTHTRARARVVPIRERAV
jgi:hypothetical protein